MAGIDEKKSRTIRNGKGEYVAMASNAAGLLQCDTAFGRGAADLVAVETSSPQKRIRILQRATEIFLDLGYAGATLEEIAQAAGVGKVAIYQLFGDKAELFAQCMIDAAGTNPVMSRAFLRRDRPVRDALVEFAEQHIRRMLHPVFGTRPFYEFVRVLLSASITHPGISARCLDILRSDEGAPLQEYFQDLIDRQMLTGGDAPFLTRHFMQTIFFTNNVILEPSSADRYRDSRASAENAVDLFLNGCADVALSAFTPSEGGA